MNPFEKFLGPEDHIHRQVCEYLNFQYPKVLWHHPNSEGKRSLFERWKAKLLGLKKGFPDILIFDRKGMTPGLFIELKAGKNKTTPEQDETMYQLRERGWMGGVHYSFESTKRVIDAYLTK